MPAQPLRLSCLHYIAMRQSGDCNTFSKTLGAFVDEALPVGSYDQ